MSFSSAADQPSIRALPEADHMQEERLVLIIELADAEIQVVQSLLVSAVMLHSSPSSPRYGVSLMQDSVSKPLMNK